MQTTPMTRLEDTRLLSGAGRYVSDFITPDMRWAGFVRTDVAAGRIVGLDIAAALAMPGVRAVLTAADLAADGVAALPHDAMPRDDGGQPVVQPQPILAGDIIGHIGEAVALVIADTRLQVLDAIEAIVLQIEDAQPLSGTAFCRKFGNSAQAGQAIAGAAFRANVVLDMPRVTAFAMEPRGIIATGSVPGQLHYRASTQNPFALRNQMAGHFGWDRDSIHVQSADVGGSFGLKGYMAVEDAALAWAARRLQMDLVWIPSRSETVLADAQGRGARAEVSIGLDADHRIVAVQAAFEVDVGAYPGRRVMGVANNINGLTGVYDVPLVAAQVVGQLSPKVPLAPFRGNGRPEVTMAIEAALDRVAWDNGLDPVAVRQRNLIPPEALPLTTQLGATLDSGDFPKVMATALARNSGAEARRAKAQARGMLYGIGLANCIESAGGPMRGPKPDFARITVTAQGRVVVAPGVMSVGQGHETGLTAMAAQQLQIDPALIDYHHGDTQAITFGKGSGGSSGLTVAGSALWNVLEQVIIDGTAQSAAQLGCDPSEMQFRDGGFFRIGSNDALSLAQIAQAASGGEWRIEQSFTPPGATFPNGTHICEVEIDPDTGSVRVTRYVAVEDVGRVLNPVLVEGQLQGGIAQGLSLGLGEQLVHDADGQLLTGSLMDYQLVRAADLPMFHLDTVEVPTLLNPLGVKGVGEAGTVGATAAFASAVGDALQRAGASPVPMPATAPRIWEALMHARAKA